MAVVYYNLNETYDMNVNKKKKEGLVHAMHHDGPQPASFIVRGRKATYVICHAPMLSANTLLS